MIFDKWDKLTEKEKHKEEEEFAQVKAVTIYTPGYRVDGHVAFGMRGVYGESLPCIHHN